MNPGLALAGKRILVTRARHQAGRLAEALEAAGAEVLRLPTIEIVPPETYAPLDHALQSIRGYDWLIVTSANGAAALAERMNLLGIAPQQLSHLQLAAIGPATAGALERIGLKVSVMPGQYVAEGVVHLLSSKVEGRHVLVVRAAIARDVIPGELQKRGAHVQVAEAYRTVIPPDSIDQVRELFAPGKPLPDAATFTSASTVNNFFALLEAAALRLPEDFRAVSIGPITSQALREHQWEPAREAVPSDIPGLTAACIHLLKAVP